MTDWISSIFEKRREIAHQLAARIAQGIYRIMRPAPTYIPRYPMSPQEQERVRRRPERSTEDEPS